MSTHRVLRFLALGNAHKKGLDKPQRMRYYFVVVMLTIRKGEQFPDDKQLRGYTMERIMNVLFVARKTEGDKFNDPDKSLSETVNAFVFPAQKIDGESEMIPVEFGLGGGNAKARLHRLELTRRAAGELGRALIAESEAGPKDRYYVDARCKTYAVVDGWNGVAVETGFEYQAGAGALANKLNRKAKA